MPVKRLYARPEKVNWDITERKSRTGKSDNSGKSATEHRRRMACATVRNIGAAGIDTPFIKVHRVTGLSFAHQHLLVEVWVCQHVFLRLGFAILIGLSFASQFLRFETFFDVSFLEFGVC